MNFDRSNPILLEVIKILREDFPTCHNARFVSLATRVAAYIDEHYEPKKKDGAAD